MHTIVVSSNVQIKKFVSQDSKLSVVLALNLDNKLAA